MTPAAEKDIRSALVGVHRALNRGAMARAGRLKDWERTSLEIALADVRAAERRLRGMLTENGRTR